MPTQPFNSPEQPHLFEAGSGQPLTGENIGRYNTVAERAERLILAINALAHRNMLMGLDVAAYDPEHKRPIWEHYLDDTPDLLESSKTKVDTLYNEAAEHFWRATGVEALRGCGIKRRRILSRVDKMWRDFTDDFGHPRKSKERNKFRRTQEKFLHIDHPLRSENRLARYKNKSQAGEQEAA